MTDIIGNERLNYRLRIPLVYEEPIDANVAAARARVIARLTMRCTWFTMVSNKDGAHSADVANTYEYEQTCSNE